MTAERAWEEKFLAVPSAARAADIESHLSSRPHRAGTPADYDTALYVRDRLAADGFSVEIQPYEVMFTEPSMQALEIVSPASESFELLEGSPGNHSKWEIAAGPAFLRESGDGDVTGQLFYLNHGDPEDFAAFDALGVKLPKGAVVLLRGGGSSKPHARKQLYEELIRRGVAGVILYTDPRDDGFVQGEVWPRGNYKNEFMVERTGGLTPLEMVHGDPTLPGKAPLPGTAHKAWSEIPHSTLPEMNVTQAIARKLLAAMTGPPVPTAWHDAFEMVEHVGGNVRVRLAVKMDRRLVTIWNVVGTLQGSTKPDEIVMIGSHRDAMTFGAIDPGSGMTDELQVADGLAALVKAGWKADRTIQIASWDGEELELYGSISLAYQKGDYLRSHVVQYINTDQQTTGPPFLVGVSTGLKAFVREIAAVVTGADEKPLNAHDSEKEPMVRAFGGGRGSSDHVTFASVLGVPSTFSGYFGRFGAHHSAEDNLDGYQTYDPGYKQAVAVAQFTGVQTMRVANAAVPPLRLLELPDQMIKDVADAKASWAKDIDFSRLSAGLAQYRAAAAALDQEMQAAELRADVAAMQAISLKGRRSRDAFWMPGGLSYDPYYHTIDRLPEISYAVDDGNDKAKVKSAIDRLVSAVERAAAALK